MGETGAVTKKKDHDNTNKQTKTQPFFFVKNIGS